MNDNPPKFDRPSYKCKVSVEAVSGQLVTVVHAEDPDSGQLRYLITDGNEHHTFRIHQETGEPSVELYNLS